MQLNFGDISKSDEQLVILGGGDCNVYLEKFR